MTKKHIKLTFVEREIIFELSKKHKSIRDIARYLERSPSTISEELRRNGMDRHTYSIGKAQVDRNTKAANKGRHSKLVKEKQPLKIIKNWLIDKKWSPEQISGRLKIKYKKDPEKHVSHETIYKYIYSLEDPHERDKFIKSLRRKRKKRKSRKCVKAQRGPISNIRSIHQRPLEVESRLIPGHWEGDSIVGKDHQSAIGTLVERTSRFTIIVEYGNDKSSDSVAKAFAKAYESIPIDMKKSLTFDRGAEMAQHEYFTQMSGVPVYFADPGSPGQRGTNENTNGLIRQFYPKKTDFKKVPGKELKKTEDLLNERPRKILGFKSPKEMFDRWRGPEPPLFNQTPTHEWRGEQR